MYLHVFHLTYVLPVFFWFIRVFILSYSEVAKLQLQLQETMLSMSFCTYLVVHKKYPASSRSLFRNKKGGHHGAGTCVPRPTCTPLSPEQNRGSSYATRRAQDTYSSDTVHVRLPTRRARCWLRGWARPGDGIMLTQDTRILTLIPWSRPWFQRSKVWNGAIFFKVRLKFDRISWISAIKLQNLHPRARATSRSAIYSIFKAHGCFFRSIWAHRSAPW